MYQKLFMLIFLAAFISLTGEPVLAANDVVIDGSLGDWSDEAGFVTDPYTDTNPERTDIVQYGLTVVDNGASVESLALVMVTDDFQNTGNASGDSHQLVFYVGSYEIVLIVQNGCDAVNEVTIDGVTTKAFSGTVAAPVNSPVNAPTDTTADCAVEIEFPISALPALDSNMNGELLDESFATSFATRQSGGVGNDNDAGDSDLSPTAISIQSVVAHGQFGLNNVLILFAGLILITAVMVLRRMSVAHPALPK